ncbi:hypothetical protein KUTeg_014947 [Tegillarca granosa]|uniref:Uncharacterized protein n=1 Tax=Tegillarca granosa TaxID=220873 RepID=A0ABQ9ENP6_TEGGR|nr:hypothetical protein KUTeg_014947 [Tegillarca granosa]
MESTSNSKTGNLTSKIDSLKASEATNVKIEKPVCEECERLGEIFEVNTPPKDRKLTKTGKVILGVTGALAVVVYGVTGPFIAPALRKYCLPFVPATSRQVKNVFTALEGRSGTLIDIGSGDGRIVIEAAKHGFIAKGVELNPWLVLYSKWKAWRSGVSRTATFTRQDLWKMEQLHHKLADEVPQSTHIVACRFPLPNLEPILTIGKGHDTVWLYRLNKNV